MVAQSGQRCRRLNEVAQKRGGDSAAQAQLSVALGREDAHAGDEIVFLDDPGAGGDLGVLKQRVGRALLEAGAGRAPASPRPEGHDGFEPLPRAMPDPCCLDRGSGQGRGIGPKANDGSGRFEADDSFREWLGPSRGRHQAEPARLIGQPGDGRIGLASGEQRAAAILGGHPENEATRARAAIGPEAFEAQACRVVQRQGSPGAELAVE